MTVDKVTINSVFGEQLTVEEYEEKQRGDLIAQEIKELYPRISGEFARTLHRGHKAKWQDPITKAVSGRYHSSEEIRKENEEMAVKTQAIRRTILLNMMEHAGQWVSPKQLAKSTGLDLSTTSHRGSLSSAVSTLYPFLEKCGVAKRRQDPNGKGYVYCYDVEAAGDPTDIIDQIFEDFQTHERERMRLKRAVARGENGTTPDPDPPSTPDPSPGDPMRDPPTPTEKIQGQVEEFLTLTQNGSGLKVNVEVNFNIRFGLLKE